MVRIAQAERIITNWLKFWLCCYVFYGLTMVVAKLSFGWLLLRIVSVPEHKCIIYGTSLAIIVTAICFFFIILFQCTPIAYYWDDSIPGGKCLNLHVYVSLGYTYSVISMLTDLVCALLPGFIIWSLQIKNRLRWVLFFLMGLGCV